MHRLPAQFSGSSRDLHEHLQEAVAATEYLQREPDFILGAGLQLLIFIIWVSIYIT